MIVNIDFPWALSTRVSSATRQNMQHRLLHALSSDTCSLSCSWLEGVLEWMSCAPLWALFHGSFNGSLSAIHLVLRGNSYDPRWLTEDTQVREATAARRKERRFHQMVKFKFYGCPRYLQGNGDKKWRERAEGCQSLVQILRHLQGKYHSSGEVWWTAVEPVASETRARDMPSLQEIGGMEEPLLTMRK